MLREFRPLRRLTIVFEYPREKNTYLGSVMQSVQKLIESNMPDLRTIELRDEPKNKE